jgi:hypothetical protein
MKEINENDSKTAQLADWIVQTAERVAGLVDRNAEGSLNVQRLLNTVFRHLAHVAETLDEEATLQAAAEAQHKEYWEHHSYSETFKRIWDEKWQALDAETQALIFAAPTGKAASNFSVSVAQACYDLAAEG